MKAKAFPTKWEAEQFLDAIERAGGRRLSVRLLIRGGTVWVVTYQPPPSVS